MTIAIISANKTEIQETQDALYAGNTFLNKEEIVDKSSEEKEDEQAVALTISEEAKRMYEEELERIREGQDANLEEIKNVSKIMEIARRIARGDHVPASDEKKVLEYNKDLYQAVKAAALISNKKNPKKYKALFDEDDDKQKQEKSESTNKTIDATELSLSCEAE